MDQSKDFTATQLRALRDMQTGCIPVRKKLSPTSAWGVTSADLDALRGRVRLRTFIRGCQAFVEFADESVGFARDL